MLLVYSGGLHHIQAPGDRLPKLFQTIDSRMELLDIATYCRQRKEESDGKSFKTCVISDLERRRDTHCPGAEQSEPAHTAPAG